MSRIEYLVSMVRAKLEKAKRYFFGVDKEKPKGMIKVTVANANELYRDSSEVKTYKFIKEDNFKINLPQHLKEDALPNFRPFKIKYESVLLDITNPNFSFRHNLLFNYELNVIYEPNIDFEDLGISGISLKKCKRIRGTIAYLSNSRANHYGHWFQYTIPFVLIYRHFFKKEDIDYYYIGDCPVSRFHIDSLISLGITKKQIVNFPCKADRLLAVVVNKENQNGTTRPYTDIFSFRFARGLFTPRRFGPKNKFFKRIYIQRGKVSYREVINEKEILKFLKKLDFIALSMDNRSIQEQADIFANANIIIAPHGTALTNLMFAKEGTKVIEILPYGYPDHSHFVFASYAKCDYYYVIGEEIDSDPAQPDIKLNIDKLKKICESAHIL
jgi:hypothetical protein